MGQVLVDVFLTLSQIIISIVTVPIDLILQGVFPDLTLYLGYFVQVIQSYITPLSGYFISMLPPLTQQLVFVYLNFLVLLGTALITYWGIVLVYKIIQKIKFW